MGCCLGGDPVTPDESKARRKSTQQICERFVEDASNNENVDIYQICAIVSNIGDDACVKYWYYFKALVCFTFQTTMLALMVYQFTHMNGRDEWEEDDGTEQYSFESSSTYIPVEDEYDDTDAEWNTHWGKMTQSIAFCASLYISVSIWNWMWDLEHQGLYRVERTFINCPKYVSHGWITIGLFANFFTLFFSLIGSNLLIYWAENALDVILNCVAIFFLLQIDNEIIGLSDYENIKRWMNTQEQRAKNNKCSSTKSRKISDPTQAAIQLADERSNTQDTVPSNDGTKDSQTQPEINIVTTDAKESQTDEEKDADPELGQDIELDEEENEQREDSKMDDMIKRMETMERKMCIGGGEECKCGWKCESYEHEVTCYTKCGCYALGVLMVITLVSATVAPFIIIAIWDKY